MPGCCVICLNFLMFLKQDILNITKVKNRNVVQEKSSLNFAQQQKWYSLFGRVQEKWAYGMKNSTCCFWKLNYITCPYRELLACTYNLYYYLLSIRTVMHMICSESTNRKRLPATLAENTFCLVNTKVYALAGYLRNWIENFAYINNLIKTFF